MSKSQDSFFFWHPLQIFAMYPMSIPCLPTTSPCQASLSRVWSCAGVVDVWPVGAAGQQPRPETGTIYGSAMLSYGSQLGKEGNNKAISNRNQQRQQWLNLHHGIPWVTVYHPSISLASTPNVLPPAPGPPLPQLRWATEVCLRVKQPHFCWMRAQCS